MSRTRGPRAPPGPAVSDQPRKRPSDPDHLEPRPEQLAKRARAERLDARRVAAEVPDVGAAQRRPGPKPRLVRDGDHEGALADPGELGYGVGRPIEVLEDLEAEDQAEAVVLVGKLVDASDPRL